MSKQVGLVPFATGRDHYPILKRRKLIRFEMLTHFIKFSELVSKGTEI